MRKERALVLVASVCQSPCERVNLTDRLYGVCSGNHRLRVKSVEDDVVERWKAHCLLVSIFRFGQASSGCKTNIRCHNTGAGQYYCGPYQVSWAYWADAGKPGYTGFSNDFENCLVERNCAEATVRGYMAKWAADCNGDGRIDCLDYAAIHKVSARCVCPYGDANAHRLQSTDFIPHTGWPRRLQSTLAAQQQVLETVSPVLPFFLHSLLYLVRILLLLLLLLDVLLRTEH